MLTPDMPGFSAEELLTSGRNMPTVDTFDRPEAFLPEPVESVGNGAGGDL